ncbi:MAG: hypothetical protein RL472_1716 [Pseudomonadota bacterium]
MAMRLGHIRKRCPLYPQQIDMHADKGLVHDMQARPWQQRMHIRHPPVGRVFHRQHAQIDRACAGHLDHIFKGLARNRGEIGPGLRAGLMRIGSKLSLKGDTT